MNNERQKNKFINLFFVIILGISLVFILICTFKFKVDDSLLSSYPVTNFNENWYVYDNGEKKTLEHVSRQEASKIKQPLIIYNTLPTDSYFDTMSIFTKNEYVKVYVDNNLIYEYGYENEIDFYPETGAIFNLITFDKTKIFGGEEIKIELTPYNLKWASNGLDDYEILIGSHNDIIINLIIQKVFLIGVCILLLGVGLYILSQGLIYAIVKNTRANELLYFGVFIILTTIWSVSDGLLLQFVFHNKMISYILFNISFLLFPLPFAMFAGEIFSDRKKIFQIFSYIFGAYFILRMAFYVFNLLNFEAGLWIEHIMMGCLISYIFILSIINWKNKVSKLMIIGLIIFGFIEALALFSFWIKNDLQNNRINYSNRFFMGTFVLIIIYAFVNFRANQKMRENAIKSKFYETCAYTDNLTDLGNRAAFEKKLDSLDNLVKQNTLESLTIFMIDLNNLKETNDTYGHEAGDILIIKMCECLQKIFANIGFVYRIGGDEMTVIVVNNLENEINNMLRKLYHSVSEYNEDNLIQISYAIGYAFTKDFKSQNIRNLFRIADVNMYKNKELIKIKN